MFSIYGLGWVSGSVFCWPFYTIPELEVQPIWDHTLYNPDFRLRSRFRRKVGGAGGGMGQQEEP